MRNGGDSLREFGRFRLDPKTRVLWHGDEPVSLPLKEIELLSVLTEAAGQVVTKDEILDRVWPGSFVEESNLTRHVYLLRKMLKEYGEGEGLIQTVPRRGYRFTGRVIEAGPGDLVIEKHTSSRTLIEVSEEELAGSSEPLPARLPQQLPWWKSVPAMAGAVVVGILLIGALLYVGIGRSRSGGAEQVRSVAVLPLKTFADPAADEELRLRITDALITRLGNMDRVALRPTSAVLPFERSDEDAVSIGKRLSVDAVIDGRIQQEGERLRVTLQMIRTSDGQQLWSGQFDGVSNQILNLQDLIFAKVSGVLAAPELKNGKIPGRLTENTDAYEAYLKGRYFWNRRDAESLQKAVEQFRLATELDPGFSEAFSGLADTEHLIFNYNIDVRPAIMDEAKRNLQRALELKPDSPDALITLGTIQMGDDWDWKAAEATLERAVAAAPNSPTAHMRYGALLMRLRRFDEAEAEFSRHLELDPLSIAGITNLGMVRFCKGDLDGAAREYRRTLEMDANLGSAHWLLSRGLWLQGKPSEALTEIVRALELDGEPDLAAKVNASAARSPLDAVRLLLYEWRNDPPGTNPHNLAYLSTYVNDREKAIYWLRRSIDEHHPWSTWIAAAPEFQPLRSDPRFNDMLRKLDLP